MTIILIGADDIDRSGDGGDNINVLAELDDN
jgi:hypothetical protein